jgi:hypothetical protein
MGRGTVRAGAPTTGTQAADGTDGSDTAPRIIIFDPPVRPCIVTNHLETEEIRVKVNTETNGTVSNDFDNDSDDDGAGHFIIPPRLTQDDAGKDPPEGGPCEKDVSCGGQLAVHSVSFVTPAGDLDSVSVVGWAP